MVVNSFSEKETDSYRIDLSTTPALKCINNSAILGFVSFLAR